MKFVKQHENLTVRNADLVCIKPSNNKRHGKLLPSDIRSVVVGPSNSGKTNVMLSLLLDSNGLKYRNVYIYSKSLQQPKYKYLEKVMSKIPEIGFKTFSENIDIIPIEQAKSNSIFIFDDVACQKQNNIRTYFCMGRHKAIDCFYLCQTYAQIPKHLVRDNTNFLCIFKQDAMNLKHIYNDHVNNDVSFETFHKACTKCWNEKYGFMVIDKDSPLHKGRYRKNFDSFIIF